MVSRVKGSSFKGEDDREKLKKEEGDFRKEAKILQRPYVIKIGSPFHAFTWKLELL